MEISGFNEVGLSETNREALQSVTWQEARKAIKTEVKHFTNEKSEPYGYPWEKAVAAYLKSGNREERQCDIEADGVTYKVLKRSAVTVFYDVDGNTLFDVENGRLLEESAGALPGDGETDTEKPTDVEQAEGVGNIVSYASGREKLLAEEDEMLASIKPEFQQEMRAQMDLIFKELISWAEEDLEFEKKVLLAHKSMKRCMKFCADKAMGIREPSDKEKSDARGGRVPIMTPVRSDTVFRWVKEYYDKDDKAEAEKEEEAASEKRRTGGKKTEGQKKAAPKEKHVKKPAEKEEAVKETTFPGRGKSMDGQLSMFDLFDA